jgi:hypothetical protein
VIDALKRLNTLRDVRRPQSIAVQEISIAEGGRNSQGAGLPYTDSGTTHQ